MTIAILHRRTGIPYTTLADWKKKGIIPKEKAPYVCDKLKIETTVDFDRILKAANENRTPQDGKEPA